MKDYKIAAVVVTYNRKDLLKKCVESILQQSYLPSCVYIIDNASTDGTEEMFRCGTFTSPLIKYIKLNENGGGAQGFYEGIKRAHETLSFDGYWVMDDDGQPDVYCLENLIKYLPQYDYIAPLVLDIDNRNSLAFNYWGSFNLENLNQKANHNIVENWACPFNGILYSKKLVSNIGYPKKEMFIWGDEANYHMRAKKAGFKPYMILTAKHYHPKEKTLLYKALTNNVIYVDSSLKTYCYHRNNVYNNKKNWSIRNVLGYIGNYSYYFIFKKHNLSLFGVFCKAFFAGLRGEFNGHKKYLK